MAQHFLIASAVVFGLATSGLAMAQDNFVGTWKLNVAKSHYNPGPPPKSQTRRWESSGKVFVEGTEATGKPSTHGYTIKPDGKDYPATGATNGAETVATKRIDANILEAAVSFLRRTDCRFLRKGKS